MPERTSALLLLINVALLFALGVAAYSGQLAVIWQADALKISFVILAIFFATGFALSFGWIGDETAEEVEHRLPMLALSGTVYGILVVFSVLGKAKFGGAADFKSLIGPLLSGGGTALWPTFLGIAGSNILWLQLIIRRWGN